MAMTREQVYAAAMALEATDREALVEELLASLDPEQRAELSTQHGWRRRATETRHTPAEKSKRRPSMML
jgi:hypothetical protein